MVRNPIASFMRQAFVNYALAVSYAFNTTETLAVINFGTDANRYLEDGCAPELWASYKEFTQQVYASLKELYPAMSVFPSFSLETMMQVQTGQACAGVKFDARTPPANLVACASAGYAALAGIPRDAFAWSAFPSVPTAPAAGGVQPWYLSTPLSFLTAAEKGGMVVANTGVLGTPLALNFANSSDYAPPLDCVDFVPSSAAAAAAWFASVNTITTKAPFFAYVINFKTARDTLYADAMACPCTVPIPALSGYCAVLTAYRGACFGARILPAACELAIKQFGTMGVRDLFGAPREPLYSALQAARALP